MYSIFIFFCQAGVFIAALAEKHYRKLKGGVTMRKFTEEQHSTLSELSSFLCSAKRYAARCDCENRQRSLGQMTAAFLKEDGGSVELLAQVLGDNQ